MSAELLILLGLAAVAGAIDAVSYLALGHVFTANVTGNVVLLGFALTGVKELSAARSLAALGAYVAGAVCGGRAALMLGRRGSSHRGGAAFGIEPAVLLAATIIAAAYGAGLSRSTAGGYCIIALTGLAMGARNGAAHRLGMPHVTTTVVTSSLAKLAADSWLGGGDNTDLGTLAGSGASMLVGAALGAWLLRYSAAFPLGGGVMVSAACTILAYRLCYARGSKRSGPH